MDNQKGSGKRLVISLRFEDLLWKDLHFVRPSKTLSSFRCKSNVFQCLRCLDGAMSFYLFMFLARGATQRYQNLLQQLRMLILNARYVLETRVVLSGRITSPDFCTYTSFSQSVVSEHVESLNPFLQWILQYDIPRFSFLFRAPSVGLFVTRQESIDSWMNS